MTESMIERVAKAIAERGGSDWETCLNAPGQRMAGMYRSMARAAIEAMREPTEFMIDMGWKLDWGPNGGYSEDHASPLTAWGTLIDAALQWLAGSADRAGVPMAED